ncbi:hypothetical protein [Streptomyces sp. NPDC059072]|uniref:hypothetical protein n=1 Tax=Streptomyces sp. NPDC059072 TaxID=3346715 RepID=UPI0036C89F40
MASSVLLPTTLREAYLLFGRRKDLTSRYDVLLSPAELCVDAAGKALIFRHENQGAASWGILLDGLQDDDPAVFSRTDLEENFVRLPFPVYPIGDEQNGSRWFLGQRCPRSTSSPRTLWPPRGSRVSRVAGRP